MSNQIQILNVKIIYFRLLANFELFALSLIWHFDFLL